MSQWIEWDQRLSEKAPEMFRTLNAPAAETAVEQFEARIGARLPEFLREAYLAHDGQDGRGRLIPSSFVWLSLAHAIQEYNLMLELVKAGIEEHGEPEFWVQPESSIEPTQRVRRDYWNPRWLPFASNLAGNLLFVDLAPGPAGSNGQVVLWDKTDFASQRQADFKRLSIFEWVMVQLRDGVISEETANLGEDYLAVTWYGGSNGFYSF